MNKPRNYISVFVFAMLGGMLRLLFNGMWSQYGTMFVNVVGCFLLAFLTYFYLEYREGRDWLATGLSTGFVGAFTTFSTFQLDSLKLLQKGELGNFAFYFFASMILGFIFAFLGMKVGTMTAKRIGGKA